VLNTSIPTDSFKGQIDASSSCKELFDQVEFVFCLLPEGILNLLTQLKLLYFIVFIRTHIVTLQNNEQVTIMYIPYQQTNKMHRSTMNIPHSKATTWLKRYIKLWTYG